MATKRDQHVVPHGNVGPVLTSSSGVVTQIPLPQNAGKVVPDNTGFTIAAAGTNLKITIVPEANGSIAVGDLDFQRRPEP